jgi:hypothetical protein
MSKPPPPPPPATAELSQAPPPVAADIKKETKRREKLAEFWSAFLPCVTISLPWQIELRLVSQRHCLHQKRKENGATTHGVLREFASHLCWRCWCPPGQLRQRLRDTQTVCVRYLLCPLLCCVVLGHYCCCVAVLCCVVLCAGVGRSGGFSVVCLPPLGWFGRIIMTAFGTSPAVSY